MNRQKTRIGALSIVVALSVTSCGGGSEATPSDDSSIGAVDDRTETQPSVVAAPSLASSFPPDGPVVVRSGELAALLVAKLGTDDAAMGAVLRAGDAGYDGLQIEKAISESNLAEDGAIRGVSPRRPALDVVTGLRRSPKEPTDLLPIEQLRREAAEVAGQEDYWPSGAQGTALILSLHLQGYSQQQIVDILVLGAEVLDVDYEGPVADGEEECGGYVIGGIHEIPQYCDATSGELFADVDEPAGSGDEVEASGDQAVAEQAGLCDGAFAPPYGGVPIVGVGAMLETTVLGPLETLYYFSEYGGFLDVAADGSFTLTADTVRLGDITIRDAPDNQVYRRRFEVVGTVDPATGDAVVTGTVDGTNVLYTGDAELAVSAAATGQLAVICDDLEPSGFFIAGIVQGEGLLEFEARP